MSEAADTEKPEITLLGDNPYILQQGTTYTEPGAIAIDNKDGDITNKIVITGSVDTETMGDYTITYTVTDVAGNTQTATRTVRITSVNSIETVNKSTVKYYISSGNLTLYGVPIREIKLYDLSGRLFKTEQAGGNDQLTVSNLSKSMYIVNIILSDGRLETLKIIVK